MGTVGLYLAGLDPYQAETENLTQSRLRQLIQQSAQGSGRLRRPGTDGITETITIQKDHKEHEDREQPKTDERTSVRISLCPL